MIRLSPSSLSTLKDCPRCFWIEQRKKVKRPRGIFPSLPGGMDRALKTYIDGNHLELPPECAGIGNARPFQDRTLVDQLRDWRRAPRVMVGEIHVSGALDDLLEFIDGKVAPWDFKTRGAATVDGDTEKYYGLQMDIYDLLLSEGLKLDVQGKAYLTYFWPGSVANGGAVTFNVETVVIDTDKDRAKAFIEKAANVMAMPDPPGPGFGCEYCKFVMDRREIDSMRQLL